MRGLSKKALLASVSAIVLLSQLIQPVMADDAGAAPAPIQDAATGTITYDRAYLDQFNNVTTALDLAQRLPGTQPMLNQGGGNSRGFATNNDPILINGKRLSGKSNDSRASLGRIPAANVLRIELINGSSPDVKASSQVGFLNFVLKEEANKGSGTWSGRIIRTHTGRYKVDGDASYSGKAGRLEYVISGSHRVPLTENIAQTEEIFDASGAPLSRIDEKVSQNNSNSNITANLTYNFDNGDLMHINGQYQKNKFWLPTTGEEFAYVAGSGFTSIGTSERNFDSRRPSWEVGGDYSTKFSDRWSMKMIGLYSKSHQSFDQSEDFLVEDSEPLHDFVFSFDRKAKEAIIRPSFNYKLNDKMELEFGDELAFNEVSTSLGYSELDMGVLVPVDLSGSDVTVKETRSETFANFTWKINSKWNLESSVTYEYSRISQDSASLNVSNTFQYIKPTFDLRYQVSKRDQLQFSVKRRVNQLNFSDFASSVSGDDDILAANPDLKPDRNWRFEVSYDHRFGNDMGNIKVTYTHTRVEDIIQQIEVSPGNSGVGNAGKATFDGLGMTGTLKFDFIGLKGLKLDANFNLNDSSIINPFTGLEDKVSGNRRFFGRFDLRKDFDDIGLSIGTDMFWMGKGTFYDIDERTDFDVGNMNFVGTYAEYKLNNAMTLTVRYENLFDKAQRRERVIYGGGLASGIPTEIQHRGQLYGPRLLVGLKGTF